MSFQNFNPKLYQEDIQFKIVSQSHNQHPIGSGLVKSLAMHSPVAADESNIFNDFMDGGGVDPSINESIRESI
jgi:hypothetical protein